MGKLTKEIVDAARPQAEKYIIWDSAIAGLGLRVMPGGTKAFIAVYRNGHGKQQWVTIGRAGKITPDHARRQVKKIFGDVASGRDPAADRAVERKSGTVADLLNIALERHWKPRRKLKTQQEAARIIVRNLSPEIGRIKVAELSFDHVARLHAKMKGTPRLANHALAILSKALSLAERWKLRPLGTNFCRLIERFPENKRQRTLTPEEMQRLGSALERAQKEGTAPIAAINAIKMLALSGARLGEVLGLRWQDVDFSRGVFVLPDSKTGARVHSFGSHTAALLEAMERSGPWVIPRTTDPNKAMRPDTLSSYWREIRDAAQLRDFRLHDLRHQVASTAGSTGANAFQVRDKLGHATIAMASRYVHNTDLRELSDRVELAIGRNLLGFKGKVVRLRGKDAGK